MKDILICRSENNSYYAINREKKKVFLLTPSFVPYFEDRGKQPEDFEKNSYYQKKYNYWKSHGITEGLGHTYDGNLTGEWVRQSLGDVKQIVFEVTDDCNLKCKYCAYGELYQDYDTRNQKNLDFKTAKQLIDYLSKIWEGTTQSFTKKTLFLSFYGGEPLMNMDLIKKVIDYVNENPIKNRIVKYSMTTNGVLLDKYMDYLAQNDFFLLLSLDGNEYNNSYRVNHAGDNLFWKIIKNIDLLQMKYPVYFKTMYKLK